MTDFNSGITLFELIFLIFNKFFPIGISSPPFSSSNLYPKDAEAPPCGVDDMTKLAYLHEPGVLQNLRSRYDMNEIYVRFQTDIHLILSMYRHYFCLFLYTFL